MQNKQLNFYKNYFCKFKMYKTMIWGEGGGCKQKNHILTR